MIARKIRSLISAMKEPVNSILLACVPTVSHHSVQINPAFYLTSIIILLMHSTISDMFVNTKMDAGPCEKVHSDDLKADFERHGDPHMYDSYILKEFRSLIAEADRVIKVILLFICLYYFYLMPHNSESMFALRC